MYLSRIQLNPARRDARRILESPHVLHAAVFAAFPDPSPRLTGRVLWRLDAAAHRAIVYVTSPEAPDLTHLAEQAGWPTRDDTWLVRPYGPLLDRIEEGHHYAFRLTANPVHSERRPDGRRGKVYGHVTVSQQEGWLLARQERSGFAIADAPDDRRVDLDGTPLPAARALAIVDRRTLAFSRRETKVTLRVATYEGLLRVTDRDAFVHALTHGIGRAKGYGCGLLTIAPAR
jgi:CRISPR system Cascade subunit CasE